MHLVGYFIRNPSLSFEELPPHAGARDRRWLLDNIEPRAVH
jgi:hypothetical protein